MGLNKLDKSICKGGKFNGREILGIRFNKKNIYETTGPSRLNIYKVYIPKNKGLNIGWDHQVTLFDRDSITGRNSSNYKPTIYWGDGTSIKEDKTGQTVFKKDYAYKDRYYTIETTCELINNSSGSEYLPGDYIEEIVSIRADYLSGENLFYGFTGIKTLSELLLQRLNTSVFSNMSQMFYNCNSLTELNLSSFNTGNVTTMSGMFENCRSLISLDLSNFDTSNVTDMSYMFYNCNSLCEVHLENCSKDTVSKIINQLPTNGYGGDHIIYCKSEVAAELTAPYPWKFNSDFEPIPLYQPGQFTGKTDLTTVETMVDSSHINLNYMFENCSNLVSVNTEDWDTSNVTTMRNMFYGCTSLVELDLSNWKTVQVADEYNMWWMFYGCSSLEFLDLSNWDLTYSTDLHYAFHGCDKLHTIKLDNCELSTIKVIISSNGFTTNAIEGITRTIYVDKSLVITDGKIVNGGFITYPPTNWVFEYIPE